MATPQEARRQLMADIGDPGEGRFVFTTTAAGTASTVVSEEFLDFDADNLATEQMTILALEAPSANEERRVSSLATNTATLSRVFTGGALGSGKTFEIHRRWSAAAKNDAITKALDLVFPQLFVKAKHEFTIVLDQFDYDISAGGFYLNTPRQVHLVSSDDTEKSLEIFDWEMVPDTNRLHLGITLSVGRTIRCWGHKKPAIADITATELGIVSARAGMYLLSQSIVNEPLDQVGRYKDAFAQMVALYQERLEKHRPAPIPASVSTDVWWQDELDFDFSEP